MKGSSGRYAVTRDRWNDVEIALYHHPKHTWNVDRMIESVQASLEYYTEAYGIEGLFDFLISCVRWMTVASGVLTAILVIVAGRVEPKGAEVSASA